MAVNFFRSGCTPLGPTVVHTSIVVSSVHPLVAWVLLGWSYWSGQSFGIFTTWDCCCYLHQVLVLFWQVSQTCAPSHVSCIHHWPDAVAIATIDPSLGVFSGPVSWVIHIWHSQVCMVLWFLPPTLCWYSHIGIVAVVGLEVFGLLPWEQCIWVYVESMYHILNWCDLMYWKCEYVSEKLDEFSPILTKHSISSMLISMNVGW